MCDDVGRLCSLHSADYTRALRLSDAESAEAVRRAGARSSPD